MTPVKLLLFLPIAATALRRAPCPARACLRDALQNAVGDSGTPAPELLDFWNAAGNLTEAPSEPPLTAIPFLRDNANATVGLFVALGDSYAAGSGVEPLEGVCGRSTRNYPQLLRSRLNPETFVDVTCGGAESRDLLLHGQFTHGSQVPPQATALLPYARMDDNRREEGLLLSSLSNGTLVTVNIGGNNESFFTWTLGYCLLRSTRGGCSSHLGRLVDKRIAKIHENVERTLRALRLMLPDALILLVGYPRLASVESGTCPDFPLAKNDVPWVVGVEEQLEQALRDAAAGGGARFVSMHEASAGHEICSKDKVRMVGFSGKGATPFHPSAELIELMAAEIERTLEDLKKEARGSATGTPDLY